jgi:hypothetical protein
MHTPHHELAAALLAGAAAVAGWIWLLVELSGALGYPVAA